MIGINISADEAQNLRRQHIKHELMDYRHYASRAEWLEDKIARLDYKLDGDVPGHGIGGLGGTAAMSAGDSWITEALAEQEELLQEKAVVDYHVDLVDTWLSCLPNDLHEALWVYVVTSNCTRLEECANELGYRTKRDLLRAVERSITEILEKS